MKSYWIYVICVIMCVYAHHSSQQSEIPSSPCPNIFQYQHDGIEWFGMTKIQGAPLGRITKTEVILSLRAQLPSQYVGTLELFGTREAAIQEIRSNQPIRYRVRFPIQNPSPKLMQISVNGRILCTGSSEIGSYVTQIKLEHTLFTELAAEQYALGDIDNVNAQDPFVIYTNRDDDNSKLSYQERPQYTSTTTEEPTYVHQSQLQYKPQAHIQQPNYRSQQESEICGRPHDRFKLTPLILGGDTIARGSWPWLVAIYLNKPMGLSFNCGGTLVSTNVVVTAAHCFKTSEREYTASEVVLFLGRYNILNWNEDGSKVVQAEQIVLHNDYMLKDKASSIKDVRI